MRARALLCVISARDADIGKLPWEWLSEYRRSNMARLANARDKALSACAELALIMCLKARHTAFAPPAQYRARASGQPVFDTSGMGWFSLAHAGDYAACAHSYAPVGVDIERRDRAFGKLKRRVLSPDEARACVPDSALARVWCAKESYLKLTGEGLPGGMENLTVAGGRVFDARAGREAMLSYFEFDGYACAVCARAPISLETRAYSFERALAFIAGEAL